MTPSSAIRPRVFVCSAMLTDFRWLLRDFNGVSGLKNRIRNLAFGDLTKLKVGSIRAASQTDLPWLAPRNASSSYDRAGQREVRRPRHGLRRSHAARHIDGLALLDRRARSRRRETCDGSHEKQPSGKCGSHGAGVESPTDPKLSGIVRRVSRAREVAQRLAEG